jgi:hypothetical protein
MQEMAPKGNPACGGPARFPITHGGTRQSSCLSFGRAFAMPMKPAKADRLIRASIHSMSYPMKNPGSRGRARGFSVERRLTLYQSMRKAPVRSMGRRSRPQSQPGLSPCLTDGPELRPSHRARLLLLIPTSSAEAPSPAGARKDRHALCTAGPAQERTAWPNRRESHGVAGER